MLGWKELRHFVIGALAALVVCAVVGVLLFVKSGMFDVAASHRHTKLTEWITHQVMVHSVQANAKAAPPAWTNSAQLIAGFCAYETHCVACHGAAGVAAQPWVNGMEPQPPYLLDVTRRFTPAQLFWIAKNGIKMTGMPGWAASLSDRQIWNVVAWLEASAKLPPQTYLQWRSARRCGTTASAPIPGPLAIPAR